jgi:hypothetical protein
VSTALIYFRGHRQRFKRQAGFGKEDQHLVSASATAKHASCCRCARRRPGIRDRGRPLPSSLPLVHSLCDHRTRSLLADGEAGKIPCVGFCGDRICTTSAFKLMRAWKAAGSQQSKLYACRSTRRQYEAGPTARAKIEFDPVKRRCRCKVVLGHHFRQNCTPCRSFERRDEDRLTKVSGCAA